MPRDFAGKIILITGGARGQGAAEAQMFAKAGAQVVIGDVLEQDGKALAAAIRAAGGIAEYRKLDVTDEQAWEGVINFVKQKFGALHVLVNNAGIALRGKNIGATTREDWERVLGVNLTGPFLGTRAAAPLIRESGE